MAADTMTPRVFIGWYAAVPCNNSKKADSTIIRERNKVHHGHIMVVF